MPEPVRCDICGKLYSSSHVNSHKRLAHAKPKPQVAADAAEDGSAILEIYATLSPENKTRILAQLSALIKKRS
jgi:predicted nucleic acid binding AN1-type Zn finger protein